MPQDKGQASPTETAIKFSLGFDNKASKPIRQASNDFGRMEASILSVSKAATSKMPIVSGSMREVANATLFASRQLDGLTGSVSRNTRKAISDIDAYAKSNSNAGKSTKRFSGEVSRAAGSIDGLTKSLRSGEKQSGRSKLANGRFAADINNRLRPALRGAEQDTDSLGKATGKFSKERLHSLGKQLKEATGKLGKFRDSVQETLSELNINGVGASLTAGGFLGATVGTASSITQTLEEYGIAAGMTRKEISELTRVSRETALQFHVNSEELASGLTVFDRYSTEVRSNSTVLKEWIGLSAKVATAGMSQEMALEWTGTLRDSLKLGNDEATALSSHMAKLHSQGKIKADDLASSLKENKNLIQDLGQVSDLSTKEISQQFLTMRTWAGEIGDAGGESVSSMFKVMTQKGAEGIEKRTQILSASSRLIAGSILPRSQKIELKKSLDEAFSSKSPEQLMMSIAQIGVSLKDQPELAKGFAKEYAENLGIPEEAMSKLMFGGEELINGMKRLRGEAYKAGKSGEYLDNIWNESGKNLKWIKDSFAAIGTVFLDMIGRPILEVLAPALGSLSDWLTGIASKTRALADEFPMLNKAVSGLVVALTGLMLVGSKLAAGKIFGGIVGLFGGNSAGNKMAGMFQRGKETVVDKARGLFDRGHESFLDGNRNRDELRTDRNRYSQVGGFDNADSGRRERRERRAERRGLAGGTKTPSRSGGIAKRMGGAMTSGGAKGFIARSIGLMIAGSAVDQMADSKVKDFASWSLDTAMLLGTVAQFLPAETLGKISRPFAQKLSALPRVMNKAMPGMKSLGRKMASSGVMKSVGAAVSKGIGGSTLGKALTGVFTGVAGQGVMSSVTGALGKALGGKSITAAASAAVKTGITSSLSAISTAGSGLFGWLGGAATGAASAGVAAIGGVIGTAVGYGIRRLFGSSVKWDSDRGIIGNIFGGASGESSITGIDRLVTNAFSWLGNIKNTALDLVFHPIESFGAMWKGANALAAKGFDKLINGIHKLQDGWKAWQEIDLYEEVMKFTSAWSGWDNIAKVILDFGNSISKILTEFKEDPIGFMKKSAKSIIKTGVKKVSSGGSMFMDSIGANDKSKLRTADKSEANLMARFEQKLGRSFSSLEEARTAFKLDRDSKRTQNSQINFESPMTDMTDRSAEGIEKRVIFLAEQSRENLGSATRPQAPPSMSSAPPSQSPRMQSTRSQSPRMQSTPAPSVQSSGGGGRAPIIKKSAKVANVSSKVMAGVAALNEKTLSKWGVPVRVTSGTDGKHSVGSKHYSGNAVDVTLPHGFKNKGAGVSSEFAGMAREVGFSKVLDEYKNPSVNATAGHLHMEGFTGGGGSVAQSGPNFSMPGSSSQMSDPTSSSPITKPTITSGTPTPSGKVSTRPPPPGSNTIIASQPDVGTSTSINQMLSQVRSSNEQDGGTSIAQDDVVRAVDQQTAIIKQILALAKTPTRRVTPGVSKDRSRRSPIIDRQAQMEMG